MKIKFCGVRRLEDVKFCNSLQPDYMGMILSSGFRRSVDLVQAASLVQQKHNLIQAVGVFVNEQPEDIARIAKIVSLDVVQLHGNETEEMISEVRRLTGLPVWKAVRVQSEAEIRQAEQLSTDALVLEGYTKGQVGGTGVTADWELLVQAKPKKPFFLAGGLKPENLRQAISIVKPAGVDLSSGIETAGVKDLDKMKEIVKIVRGE